MAKKKQQPKAALPAQGLPARNAHTPTSATTCTPTSTPTTNYDELQSNEVTALQAIYGEDFIEQKGSHSAWKKFEPTFHIRIKAPSDDQVALTLGVVLVATYPKSPPLLSLKDHTNLRDATLFKIQKFLETQPIVLAKEEQEMIFGLIEGIQEFLQEAAEAKAAGKALPTLVEERAAHEAALVEMAQEQKNREEKKKMEEAEEEAQMLQKMLQDEVKRKQIREKEANRKNRPIGVSFAPKEHDKALSEVEHIRFDQSCSLTDSRGHSVMFDSVTGMEELFRGPTTIVYEVRPVLHAGHKRPKLALKQVEVHDDGKDQDQFRKQLNSLERKLDSMKRLRHEAIQEVLEYRLDRKARITDSGNVMSWNVLVLSPLAEPGSLEILLRGFQVNHDRARSWTVSLLDALGHLHSQGLVHQDIHLGNIMVVRETNGDLVPKLADVGYQRELHKLTTAKTVTSMTDAKSAYWFPPEIAAALSPQYTPKTDVWDFGIVFLQLFLGTDVVKKYASPANLVASLPLSSPLEDLVNDFFTLDSKKRPRPFDLSSSVFLATDAEIYTHDASTDSDSEVQPLPLITPTRPRPRGESFGNRGYTTSRYKEDFVEEGRIGKGGFGKVVKARKKLDGQIYAIKKISQKSPEGLATMLKEVRVLSQLSHPSVVRYFNTWLEEIWDPSEALENESTDTEGSEDDMSTNDRDNEYPKHHSGLDFISSNDPVDDSESDAGVFNDGDSDDGIVFEAGDGIVFESSSDGTALAGDSEAVESDDNDDELSGEDAKTLALPQRKHERRSSHRPLKTILYISMEYCDKQCLRDLIEDGLHRNQTEVWRLFRQTLQGLAHIHSLGIIHRDLKPDNVFISVGPDGVNNVKIGDFGLASKGHINMLERAPSHLHGGRGGETRSIGTSVYVAPEVRSGGKGHYTSKVDMYSLGITFFEMCVGSMFSHERALKLEDLRNPHPVLPPELDSASAQASIILSLVTHNIKERPSAAALLESKYLPDEMESDTIRRAIAAITDENSPFYGKVLSTLFSFKLDQARDYAWDMPDPGHQAPSTVGFLRQRVVKETLISIFKTHGALEIPSPGLYPHSSHHHDAVKLMDLDGTVLQLPYDLMMGHSRMLATEKEPILGSSYSFGRVFRKQQGGGRPNQFGTVDFNVVSTNALDLSLKEAGVLKVVDQVVHTFSTLPASQMAFQLNHSDLLQIIFEACGVDIPVRRAAAEALSKLNISDMTWTKLRTELRDRGVSATAVDELQRFDFRDNPSKAFSKLKTLFEKTKYYQQAASTVAHLTEVYQYSKSLGVKTKILITPLHCYDEASFKGGMMFSCVCDKGKRWVLAAGGRYDNLIREHGQKAGNSSSSTRHAVGVTFALEKLVQVPVKAVSKKASREAAKSLFVEKPYDVLVASFDPIIRKTTALEVLRDLWDNGVSAELANDARSSDNLIPDNPEEQPAWMVIVKSDIVKVKTLWTKDKPEDDMPTGELSNWLRIEMRERDSTLKTTSALTRARTGLGPSDTNNTTGLGDLGAASSGHQQQQLRVLTAQTKSKKVNRQAVVDQALSAVPRLLQEFREGPIAVVELTTDDVLHAIKGTKLSEPETWRRLDINNVEKNYVKEIQVMLTEFRDGGAKHAFIYNSRGGGCVYYDLTK